MSRCTCNNPCTCYFEYDGDRPSTPYPYPYQYGRYNTRRKGSGTVADPYVIEFLDSEEFQVEAAQIHSTGDQILTSSGTSDPANAINVIDYETPYEFFVAFEATIALAQGNIIPAHHRFWYVSAEATFVNNQLTPGMRRLYISWHPSADFYGNIGGAITVAGNSSSALPAGTEDITLNCAGLSPFANTAANYLEIGDGGYFNVLIQQSSGAVMTVRNIKFTAVAV